MVYELFADSGSTKTDWLLMIDGEAMGRLRSQGINPYILDEHEIEQILEKEVRPELPEVQFDRISFYGAGCRPESAGILCSALKKYFNAEQYIVDSDILGAARLLCKNQAGIVGILGTGANSCFYDGTRIVENISPLGYILGDEGSGAALGKRLIGDVYKHQLPADICADFLDTYKLSVAEILQRTYRSPLPNRFLASFAPFLNRHRGNSAIHDLLVDEFQSFFRRNICLYGHTDVSVHFVGSIAFYFRQELEIACQSCGYELGKVRRSPLDTDCED